jgi:hypothetical protein
MGEESDLMNQQAALNMARSNYMANDNNINTLLSELTDPDKQIYEIELRLKGKAQNELGEIVKVSEPLLNEEGVANMVRLVQSMVSRVMFMSNLTDEQVGKLTIELGWVISTDLIRNKIKYNVKDKDRSTIVTLILYPSFESANAALENGFRRFLKSGIIETTINTQGNPMKSGKGGIGSLLGIGRK